MAEPSDRIMKFVGAARNEKGAEAAKELGSLLYDKAAEKLDQFSTDIEFGTDSFAPQEDVNDEVIDQALEADGDNGEEIENVDGGAVEEISQADEGEQTSEDIQNDDTAGQEETVEQEETEVEEPEDNGEETETDSSRSE